MQAGVREGFLAFTERFEGHTSWMYLDVEGLVTIGYGNLIDPNIPSTLDFRDLTGIPADASAVRYEWQRIKSLQRLRELGGGVFRAESTLRATQTSLEALFYQELDSFERDLRGYFPAWDTWPAAAQQATLSIAWACGSHFPPEWPHFTAAARVEDWAACAMESHISTKGNPGVVPRNEANVALFTSCVPVRSPGDLDHPR